MKQWVGLGKFLAGHMQIIVPICVALGVLFPQQIGVLKPIVPTLFAFMTFQGALSNTFHQVAEVFRRPLHLILALIVSAVLIPIAAYAMGSLFFGSNPNLVCGIVLEYSIPVAVTAFMWISMFGGNGPLALTIILTSSVISPLTIPLTLKLLLGATVSIDVPSMMQDMAFMIAIPAVLGIVINELTRGWGHEKLSPHAFARLQVHDDGGHRVQLHRHERVRAAHEHGAPGSRPLYFGLRHQRLCRRFSGRPYAASAV